MFCEKGVLRNFAKFTGKHLCQSLFFNKVADAACNFIKKETLAQVFSCEFCEISKNTFFYRTPLVAASENEIPALNSLKSFEFKPKTIIGYISSSSSDDEKGGAEYKVKQVSNSDWCECSAKAVVGRCSSK